MQGVKCTRNLIICCPVGLINHAATTSSQEEEATRHPQESHCAGLRREANAPGGENRGGRVRERERQILLVVLNRN